MEHTTFCEHYRVCDDEAAHEVSRTGAAINYKAIDTRSHERVQLQLIPLATIDPEKLDQLKERAEIAEKLDHVNIAKTFAVGVEHDYFALVSEYLEGETADAWIVANGPMAADAALRVGLQVVRALGAAAYFNLSHRAIQPSNLMILPGQSPDGGWPYVKLLNFGLAGLELHANSGEAREIAPSISPQFASPEQRSNGEIDFRSEMYSLGATMCFLLTGAAPLAVSGVKARLRRLPELRRAPKALHNLLVYLLRENPENRPQDPVALEGEMRQCLTKIERRQALGQRLGIPLAAVVPRKAKEPKQPASPLAQVLRGFAAVAVFVVAAAAAAEYFFPDKIPYFRRTEKVGVPIGIPDAAKFATAPGQTPTVAPAAANQPMQNASPAIAEANESSPTAAEPDQASKTADRNTVTSPTQIWNQIASNAKTSEPPAPGLGPTEPTASAQENSDQSSPTESTESSTRDKTQATTSGRRSTLLRQGSGGQASESSRTDRMSPNDEDFGQAPNYQTRRHVARVVGRTRDGRLIVRLSSGRVVVLPRLNGGDTYAPRPRHRLNMERSDNDGFVPPSQPFYPND